MEHEFPLLLKHKLLYDGEEEAYYTYPILFELPSEKVECTVLDFKNVFHLKALLNDNEFASVLALTNGEKIQHFDSYKGQDNLSLVYCIKRGIETAQEFLIVLTKGEYQPGRFMIFAEGIWPWPELK